MWTVDVHHFNILVLRYYMIKIQKPLKQSLLMMFYAVGCSFTNHKTLRYVSRLVYDVPGSKKRKFLGELIEISRGPLFEDDRRFMTSQKGFLFFKALHSSKAVTSRYFYEGQTYCNCRLCLTSKHVFENFGGQLPGCPPGCGLALKSPTMIQ